MFSRITKLLLPKLLTTRGGLLKIKLGFFKVAETFKVAGFFPKLLIFKGANYLIIYDLRRARACVHAFRKGWKSCVAPFSPREHRAATCGTRRATTWHEEIVARRATACHDVPHRAGLCAAKSLLALKEATHARASPKSTSQLKERDAEHRRSRPLSTQRGLIAEKITSTCTAKNNALQPLPLPPPTTIPRPSALHHLRFPRGCTCSKVQRWSGPHLAIRKERASALPAHNTQGYCAYGDRTWRLRRYRQMHSVHMVLE